MNFFLADFLNVPRTFNSGQVKFHPLWLSTANRASNILLMHAVDEWTQLTFSASSFLWLGFVLFNLIFLLL